MTPRNGMSLLETGKLGGKSRYKNVISRAGVVRQALKDKNIEPIEVNYAKILREARSLLHTFPLDKRRGIVIGAKHVSQTCYNLRKEMERQNGAVTEVNHDLTCRVAENIAEALVTTVEQRYSLTELKEARRFLSSCGDSLDAALKELERIPTPEALKFVFSLMT